MEPVCGVAFRNDAYAKTKSWTSCISHNHVECRMPAPRAAPVTWLVTAGRHTSSKQAGAAHQKAQAVRGRDEVHVLPSRACACCDCSLYLSGMHSTYQGCTLPIRDALYLSGMHSTYQGCTLPIRDALYLSGMHSTYQGCTLPIRDAREQTSIN
jgi:hypothetical protein